MLLSAATLLAAPAAADAKRPSDHEASESSIAVCNERENSARGGYVLTDPPVDPNPRDPDNTGTAMKVGHGQGLAHAAQNSPALRACALGGPSPEPDPF